MAKHLIRLMTVILLIAVVLLSVNPELAMIGYHIPVMVHTIHHVMMTTSRPSYLIVHITVHIQVVVNHIEHHVIHIQHLAHLAHVRHERGHR